jgi:hypothetical protein
MLRIADKIIRALKIIQESTKYWTCRKHAHSFNPSIGETCPECNIPVGIQIIPAPTNPITIPGPFINPWQPAYSGYTTSNTNGYLSTSPYGSISTGSVTISGQSQVG